MFDLDEIEKDWKENSFCLTDQEVLDIFKQEGVTTKDYKEYRDDVWENYIGIRRDYTAEYRLLRNIFGFSEEAEEEKRIREEVDKKLSYKPHLSKEGQNKVVEGCMDIVFDSTREWYDYFKGNIPMENLYYVCLNTLISSARHCIHYYTKTCFRSYVLEGIRKNMIKFVSRLEHIPYRNAYAMMNGYYKYYNEIEDRIEDSWCAIEPGYKKEFEYDNNFDKEVPTKASYIYEMIKNDSYEVDFIKKQSTDEFLAVYDEIIEELPYIEKMTMRLFYNYEGSEGLTINEISDYLGIESNEVINAKRRVLRKLKKDERIKKFHQ